MEEILTLLHPIEVHVGISKTRARKDMAQYDLPYIQEQLLELRQLIAEERRAAQAQAKPKLGVRLLSFLKSGSALNPLEVPN